MKHSQSYMELDIKIDKLFYAGRAFEIVVEAKNIGNASNKVAFYLTAAAPADDTENGRQMVDDSNYEAKSAKSKSIITEEYFKSKGVANCQFKTNLEANSKCSYFFIHFLVF